MQKGSQLIRSILVATNGTPRAEHAILVAANLACRLKSTLRVEQVAGQETHSRSIHSMLNALETRVKSVAGSADVATTVSVKPMADHFESEEVGHAAEILKSANAVSADLIVVGAHDPDNATGSIMGTVTERLLRDYGCPILIAVNDPPRDYRTAVVAIDFSAFSSIAIEQAIRLAPNAELHLVHAYDPPAAGWFRTKENAETLEGRNQKFKQMIEEQMAQLSEQARMRGTTVVAELHAGSATDIIQQSIEEVNPDLIVMGTHGRTGLVGKILGSVSKVFISNPPCDVLAIKAW